MNYTKQYGVSFCLVLAFSGLLHHARAERVASPKMADLNALLDVNHSIKLEMVKAYDRAQQLTIVFEKFSKTSKEISIRDEEQIKQYVKSILGTVKAFFALGNDKNIAINSVLEDVFKTKTSLLAKFSNAKDEELFFETEVTNKELLLEVCKEYITVFNALGANPAPEQEKTKKTEKIEKVEKLTSPKMAVLNTVMEFKPIVMLEMFKTFERAQQLNAAIEKSGKTTREPSARDKEQIKQYLKAVLTPVRDFFTIVKDKGNLIKPLLEESLKTKTSILAKFFDAKNDEVFFDTEVTTRELLQQACQEYITFFKALEASLSNVAMTKFQQEKARLFAAREKAELDKKSKK